MGKCETSGLLRASSFAKQQTCRVNAALRSAAFRRQKDCRGQNLPPTQVRHYCTTCTLYNPWLFGATTSIKRMALVDVFVATADQFLASPVAWMM
jgi:hypothetical protein